MTISVQMREDGKLVISCGDESIVYPKDSPALLSSSGRSDRDLAYPITITPGGGTFRCELGTPRRLNPKLLRELYPTVNGFETAIATAYDSGWPAQRLLRLGWRASEPLQIAELRRAVENQDRVTFDIEIWPIKDQPG
jgi:hypothetical protein